MFRVKIHPQWEISVRPDSPLDTAALLALLKEIQDTGSIARAAKAVRLSYRYAWGLLREAEGQFGQALLATGRGRGTSLTALAQKLVWADRRIAARLSPMLESLASELENELGKMVADEPRALRLDASHGFAVAALTQHLQALRLPVELRYRNSTDALAALARGECDLAGFHVPVGPFQQPFLASCLRWLDPAKHCVLHLAVREQGLFVAPGNPLGIRSVADLAAPGVRFVNRQTGSGTRLLLEMLLAEAGIEPTAINGFGSAEFTHSAVAAYIASGMADVGLGVRTAAERFGLAFIPLLRERYFLALPCAAAGEAPLRDLVGVVRAPACHALIDALPGYDATATGTMQTLAEAFGVAA
ncbi:substrate-binding domain-containing protein [[Empedobacter] haloabium]|uniref:Substrate-binding domain-containing protein n=1 Tax=[Empedobacter] haloabium TaxID=592317 RepID=A0ABZ1UU63_9BURK